MTFGKVLKMKLKLRLSREARRKFLNFRRSQTRIRPGFEAESHEQEPDTNQARNQSPEPRARARRASGQEWRAAATGKSQTEKSQTRIRPGLAGSRYRQEPDARQARDRERHPGAKVQEGGGGARTHARARARAHRLEKTIPDTRGSGIKKI